MGIYKIRRNLVVAGGKVELGADCNLYRDTTNRLKTDDALEVAGTANLVGATRIGGSAVFGTACTVPYTAFTPAVGCGDNGDVRMYLKAGIPYLQVKAGGTVTTVGFPISTHGTITVTIGTAP